MSPAVCYKLVLLECAEGIEDPGRAPRKDVSWAVRCSDTQRKDEVGGCRFENHYCVWVTIKTLKIDGAP